MCIAPNKLASRFKAEIRKHFGDDEETLYCIRMWFGSRLDLFQWQLLRDDVILNKSSRIPELLPYNQYRHILIFDSTLIKPHETEEIQQLCKQGNIYPLSIQVSKFYVETDYRFISYQFQCLLTSTFNNVAIFDFDVRMKRPIHSMLRDNTIIPQCMVADKEAYAIVQIRVYTGVIYVIDSCVIRCPASIPRCQVGRYLFPDSKRLKLLQETSLEEYQTQYSGQNEWLNSLVDAKLFKEYVIETPQRYTIWDTIFSDTIFKKNEMKDTMYCVRMWFGSELTEFEWKILQEDVVLHKSPPSWLPFKRYVHILVFDSALVPEETAAYISHRCKELDIHPLDIDLYRTIPSTLETRDADSIARSLAMAKDRLQCLFLFYLDHVATFDLDVRLEIPIHQMLKNSHDIFIEHCTDADVSHCLASTGRQNIAFVKVSLHGEKDKFFVDTNFDTIDVISNTNPNCRFYLVPPNNFNAIDEYVRRCPRRRH